MNNEEIRLKLRDILKNRLDIELDGEEPSDDDGLFDEWGLDSVDILDLVLAMEQEFGVKVQQDDEEAQQHFHSIASLAGYISIEMEQAA